MAKRKSPLRKIDKVLLVAILSLVAFGVLMVYDATVAYSVKTFGVGYHFLVAQLFWVLLGILLMLILATAPISVLKKYSKALYFLSIVLLVLVLLPTSFSEKLNGARRWLTVNPKPLPLLPVMGRVRFQPSDFAKLAYLLYGSFLLGQSGFSKSELLRKFFFITALPLVLIILEPDFGTSLVFVSVGAILLFISDQPLRYFILGIPASFLAGLGIILSSPYRKVRLMTFINGSDKNALTGGYHIKQALIALGSGGFFGLGIGQSRQKYSFLPEVASDSIFAIIGEELGFMGTVFILSIISFLVYRAFTLSLKIRVLELRVLAVGAISLFTVQAFMNIGAMLKVIPLTGIPLPLISYGGSSMVFGLGSLGLLLNASRYARR